MDKIICHIVGLNDDLKQKIINIFNKKNLDIEILDLDVITQKIVNDKYMNLMYNKYENLFEQSKKKGSDKSLTKKYKDIEKKMNEYWKSKFALILRRECNKIKKSNIILVGLNIHFKNHRINVKIDCKLLFFARLNLEENSRKVIESNLDNHRDEIIAGTFPLQYLDSEFLVKKRVALQEIFSKMKYEIKSISSIIEIVLNNLPSKNIIPNLYVSSYKKLDKKVICDNRIISYSVPWLSIISLEKDFKKGFKKNKAFIQETNGSKIDELKKKCFLYEVSNDKFYYHENGKKIKFASTADAKIINQYLINDIYEYMIENDIKLIKSR